MKRIVLRRPLGKSHARGEVGYERSTYDMLMERSSVQPRDECLDREERGQNTSEHSDESENNWDTGRHAGRSMEVPLQRRSGITDVVVSELLDPESAVSSPPN